MKINVINTGSIFGRLKILKALPARKDWRRLVLCQCSCGKQKVIRYDSIYSRRTTSCGCFKKEQVAKVLREKQITHGESTPSTRTAEYRSWSAMINRCENKNCERFNVYGFRGIGVCKRWRNSYELFLSDMGRRPDRSYSLDRINVNDGYSPENCRWATIKQQARNKTNTKLLTVNGQTKPLGEWCDEFNTLYSTVWNRIRSGWNPIDALKIPIRKMKN